MDDQETKRVLIVEDEYLIALELEDLLNQMGHQVVGPAARIGEAMNLAATADIDCAVLDLNIAGAQSFPIASVLRDRGIPFVFATGYGADGLVDGFRDQATLRKPYDRESLKRVLTTMLTPIGR